MAQVLPADPSDNSTITHDWADELASSETVSTSDSVTSEPSGDLTIGSVTVASPLTTMKVSDWVKGKIYRISETVTTSDGNVLERSSVWRAQD